MGRIKHRRNRYYIVTRYHCLENNNIIRIVYLGTLADRNNLTKSVRWIPDTFPLNYSYTLLEEARKVPPTAFWGTTILRRLFPTYNLTIMEVMTLDFYFAIGFLDEVIRSLII